MEIGQRLDVEAAPVIGDHLLQLLDVFSGPIDDVIAGLIVVTGDKDVAIYLTACYGLPVR